MITSWSDFWFGFFMAYCVSAIGLLIIGYAIHAAPPLPGETEGRS